MKKKQKLFIDNTGTSLTLFLVPMFIAFFIMMMFTSMGVLTITGLTFGVPSAGYLIYRTVQYFRVWRIIDGKRRRDENGKKVEMLY